MGKPPLEQNEVRRRRLLELRDRFIQSTLSTRSLRLSRQTRNGCLDLSPLQRLANPTFLKRLLQTLNQGIQNSPLPLCPLHPGEELKDFANHIATIAHAAREERLEAGTEDLAIGWLFLEGKSRAGTWIRAPLFLFPVDLSRSSTGRLSWEVSLRDEIHLNEPFVEFLVREEGIRVELETFAPSSKSKPDAFGLPDLFSTQGIATIEEVLLGLELPIESTSNVPLLEALVDRSTEDRDEAPAGAFVLRRHLILGRFPSSASNVIVDYDDLLKSDLSAERLGLVSELLLVDEDLPWEEETPLEERTTGPDKARPEKDRGTQGSVVPPPEETTAIGEWQRWQLFDSDASQDAVFRFLEEAEKSAGLVVQGPPGTGKSQLIANLVGSGIARGDRILVVCSKRAALDVVATRLASVGLEEPIALVHDVRADRTALYQSISETLAHLDDHLASASERRQEIARARQEHSSAMNRLLARLKRSHQAFQELALFEKGRPSLASLQERNWDDDDRPLPDLSPVAEEITSDELYALLPEIETRAAHLSTLQTPEVLPGDREALILRGPWESLSQEEIFDLFEKAQGLQKLVTQGRSHAASALMTPEESQSYDSLWTQAAAFLDMVEYDRSLMEHFLLFWTFTEGEAEAGQWQAVMNTLQKAKASRRPVPSELITTSKGTLKDWIAELEKLKELSSHWYRFFLPSYWKRRALPTQILDRCTSWSASASTNPLPVDVASLCREALEWQKLNAAMPDDNPLFHFGFAGKLEDIDLAIDELHRHHGFTATLHSLQQTLKPLGAPYDVLPELGPHLEDPRDLPTFQAALSDRALSRDLADFCALSQELAAASLLDVAVAEELQNDFAGGHFEKVQAQLTPFLEAGQKRAALQEAHRFDQQTSSLPHWARYFLKRYSSSATPGEDCVLAVQRSWMALILRGRSPAELEAPLLDPEYRQRLTEDLRLCRQQAGQGAHSLYSERISQAVEDQNRRQTLQRMAGETRKRQNRPTLRQLTERFWNQGLSLLRPVWFCSPEAVSALFPLETDFFDLVIFDEASQCTVESALPALLRSQKAIIAGDDQQMPPSRFFQAALDEHLDEEAAESTLLGTPSILELGRAVFTNTTLRWHYRSRFEELIAFSNHAFYGQGLITAPQAAKLNPSDLGGLHYRHIDGLWVERHNPTEVEAVVDLIAYFLGQQIDGVPPSIGVVAFNRKQAEAIELAIDDRSIADRNFADALNRDARRLPVDQLFVRNLENVQGDQRDLIILSPGYGPTEAGGPVHSRFGPISQEGGEKRLNVAITRARYGLWVLSSMTPEDLKVDQSRHPGPRQLRAYLGFARAHSQGDRTTAKRWLQEATDLSTSRGVTGAHRRSLSSTGPGQRVKAELIKALKSAGHPPEVDYGLGSHCLDIALPEFSIGIDCTAFLQTRDSLARDVYGPAFWERMGWHLLRISPTSWQREGAGEVIDVIEEFLREKLLEQGSLHR